MLGETFAARAISYMVMVWRNILLKWIFIHLFLGCQAIILQCSDGTALASAVDDAEAAGVPVITLNLDAYTTHSALVMAVDYDAGRMAAEGMAKQMGEKGNVVIIEGVAGLTRTDNLEKGFKDTIAKYPDIKVLDAQAANFE